MSNLLHCYKCDLILDCLRDYYSLDDLKRPMCLKCTGLTNDVKDYLEKQSKESGND